VLAAKRRKRAQKSESECVTEATELGHRGGGRRLTDGGLLTLELRRAGLGL